MAVVINGTNGVTFSDASVQDKGTQATGTAPVYAMRMWVSYLAATTVVISASGNVSSITDVATGLHNPSMLSAMPDTKYAFVGGHTRNSTSTQVLGTRVGLLADKTTTSVGLNSSSAAGAGNSYSDGDEVYAALFR